MLHSSITKSIICSWLATIQKQRSGGIIMLLFIQMNTCSRRQLSSVHFKNNMKKINRMLGEWRILKNLLLRKNFFFEKKKNMSKNINMGQSFVDFLISFHCLVIKVPR